MFRYLIAIEPLGFLYGSAGRFLSPENLVGRSGMSFPPSAPVVVGLLLHALGEQGRAWLRSPENQNLRVAGPFWAESTSQASIQNFYVPTPLNCLVREGAIERQMQWDGQQWTPHGQGKYDSRGWVNIQNWEKLAVGATVASNPWKFAPHLHPRLAENERKVLADEQRGSLFLENAVAMRPETCLVYLATHEIPAGWYRFGGEGHMVDLRCLVLAEATKKLLAQPMTHSFATITPAVWGSRRLCHRYPMDREKPAWTVQGLLTERPQPYRYRLGGQGTGRRLSRGRYAVPAGTVYVVQEKLQAWADWPAAWFPQEGYSLQRWGCGLALPLPSAIASG